MAKERVKDVSNRVGSPLTGKGCRTKTKWEENVKIKGVAPVIGKKDVVSRIHWNLSVSAFQIFLVKVTPSALGENKVNKIGGTRQ